MEQTRKHLKSSSIVVLVFAGFYLLQLICTLLFGDLNDATIPEGAPDNILFITKIFLLSFSLLMLVPHIYIGVKGLKIAKAPRSSSGHIVWASILLVFASLSLIEPVANFINNGGTYDNAATILSITLEVAVYFDYIKHATALKKQIN